MRKIILLSIVVCFALNVNAQLINEGNGQVEIAGALLIDDPKSTSDWNTIWQSGFFEASSKANAPETGWFWGINLGHTSNKEDYRYGGQILIKNSYNSPTMYFRSKKSDGVGTWARVLHSEGDQTINGNILSNQYRFPSIYYDFSAAPRTQISSMSIKLFDDYHTQRPGGVAPGNNAYGTLLAIYGRSNHWEHNLYFGANKKLYYRTSTWSGGSSENGTGNFNNWRTILDSESDIESSGNLKITGNGNHYIATGNVGIGTTSPLTKLQVGQNNSSKTTDELMRLSMDVTEPGIKTALHIDANLSSSSWDKGIAIELGLKSNTYNEYTSRIVHYGNSGSTRASKLQLQTHSVTDGVWNTGILIDNVGNVGIGTTNPTYKLAVAGTIGCGEVIVEDYTKWPDFVFEKNYELMPLKELDNYIQKNKHLPEIPTTAEVEENGISVGEMNAKLLQKIEELTLYMIEKDKEIDELKTQVNNILNQLNTLKNEN